MTQRSSGGRRILTSVVAVLVIIGVGVGAWFYLLPGPLDFAGSKHSAAGNSAAARRGVPAELANASQIQKGEYLAGAADCLACHTTEDGKPFAGGRAFVLPFGALYSTNITP